MGLVLAEFRMRDLRSRELIAVSVIPVDVDIDDGELHLVTMVVGDRSFTGWSSFYRPL